MSMADCVGDRMVVAHVKPPAPVGRFLTPLPVPILHVGKRLAITLARHSWQDADGTIHSLERGFPTDGASLPWLVTWRWDPWDPKVLPAALTHDGGYSLRDTEFAMGTKEQVDARFRLGMKVLNFEGSNLFWWSVARFGGVAWRSPNVPIMDGWLRAVREGSLDAWIASFQMYFGVTEGEPTGASTTLPAQLGCHDL